LLNIFHFLCSSRIVISEKDCTLALHWCGVPLASAN
jgi:hypothetical protein